MYCLKCPLHEHQDLEIELSEQCSKSAAICFRPVFAFCAHKCRRCTTWMSIEHPILCLAAARNKIASQKESLCFATWNSCFSASAVSKVPTHFKWIPTSPTFGTGLPSSRHYILFNRTLHLPLTPPFQQVIGMHCASHSNSCLKMKWGWERENVYPESKYIFSLAVDVLALQNLPYSKLHTDLFTVDILFKTKTRAGITSETKSRAGINSETAQLQDRDPSCIWWGPILYMMGTHPVHDRDPLFWRKHVFCTLWASYTWTGIAGSSTAFTSTGPKLTPG